MPAGPRARWGYHRLTDVAARRVVQAAGIEVGDLVLDLGAGDGALTRLLLERGAKVVAFELHPLRCKALRRSFPSDGVRVVQADIADLRLPRRPFKVVANPPWSVSAAVIRRLTSRRSRLLSADLVLPWYVTDRYTHESRLCWDLCRGARLRRTDFRPESQADGVVLKIRRTFV